MFGRNVFGDSETSLDASVARPVDMSPSQIPINADASQAYPISQVDPNDFAIGKLRRLPPPGTIIGVDPTKPIDERTSQSIPVSQTDPQSYPIPPNSAAEPGPGGMTSFEEQRWMAWLNQNQPGIFHRPPMVGQGRYGEHRFGPPTLGASPDGLGALPSPAQSMRMAPCPPGHVWSQLSKQCAIQGIPVPYQPCPPGYVLVKHPNSDYKTCVRKFPGAGGAPKPQVGTHGLGVPFLLPSHLRHHVTKR